MRAWCLWRSEGNIGSPGTGVKDSEPTMGARNQTQVLRKSNGCSQLLSCSPSSL